ncbi:MAG: hypothetical protein AAFV80_23655, partial [Bacteroidota bacterium]
MIRDTLRCLLFVCCWSMLKGQGIMGSPIPLLSTPFTIVQLPKPPKVHYPVFAVDCMTCDTLSPVIDGLKVGLLERRQAWQVQSYLTDSSISPK